jgi:hypothetical protein
MIKPTHLSLHVIPQLRGPETVVCVIPVVHWGTKKHMYPYYRWHNMAEYVVLTAMTMKSISTM